MSNHIFYYIKFKRYKRVNKSIYKILGCLLRTALRIGTNYIGLLRKNEQFLYTNGYFLFNSK